MTETEFALNLLLPLLYLAVLGLYAADFFNSTPRLQQSKRYVLYLTVGLHFLYLALQTFLHRSLPIAGLYQAMSTIALTLTVAYLFIEFSTQESSTGAFVLGVAFLFQMLSSLLVSVSISVEARVSSPMLAMHILAALLGYSAISIAGVYGVLYIALFRQIQMNRFGMLFERLPNLETLEKMSLYAVRFGFVFLSLAFIMGALWIPESQGRFRFGDAKLLGLIVVWLVYGISLLLRARLGWQGKRMAMMLALSFLFSFLAITALNFFSPRFHHLN